MKEQTKLYRILRYAYLNRDKTFTNRDVANGTNIPITEIPSATLTLYRYIKKKKIGFQVYYNFEINRKDYIKKLLENRGMLEDEE